LIKPEVDQTNARKDIVVLERELLEKKIMKTDKII
jgi:hypothetical protein